MKRQLSEDLRGMYPQKKVARPVALVITISLMPNKKLMILKDSGSRGHQAVSLKCKYSKRFLDVHPPNKVARPAGGGPPGRLLAPLKRKHSLGTHSLNKVACIAAQGIDLALACLRSNKVSSSHQQYLQGNDSSLPNELLILIAAYLPQESLRSLTQVCSLFQEVAAPPFFQLLHFVPPDVTIFFHIEHTVLEALSVWRHTKAFVMPDSIWFSVTEATTDCHLNALSAFFESLQGYDPVPRHLGAKTSTAMMSNNPIANRKHALSQATSPELHLVTVSLKS
ncbi:hypothetical protein SCLCIDRAFT_30268 [Scleroderma citrinum Foug A]|uniref:F-box domain-containing protein n=1 Tax=Scleroderma citrinum Foug A TaxID=1036808 RepID=A0A0C3DGT5_9AGAM|nr:hypothetical protein SCLCIDRAFT_30268 [Scleroderma citrinum Foug A]